MYHFHVCAYAKFPFTHLEVPMGETIIGQVLTMRTKFTSYSYSTIPNCVARICRVFDDTGSQVDIVRVNGPLATDDSYLASASCVQVHEYIAR